MLCIGLHLFIVPKYDMVATSKLIFKRKISCIYGVPALFQALSRTEEIESKDLSFIRQMVCSGDKVPKGLIERINSYLEKGGSRARVLEAYGQTESAVACCISPYFKPKAGSCGLPFPDTEVKICSFGSHEEVPAGETGEICIFGPTLMTGYLHHPEETDIALQLHEDGKRWLHTTDLGHKDEEGYLYFDGRASRMIISSGYNVYPQEIERIIDELPFVSKCFVVGVDDKIVGQRVRAYIVPEDEKSDKSLMKDRITEYLKERVAEYALPSEIIFRESLPETSLGKVDASACMKL